MNPLFDPAGFTASLLQGGLSLSAVERLHQGVERVARLLSEEEASGAEPAGAWWVPGRIELFGKHTDYAGGRSLLAAVDRGFLVAATRTERPEVRIVDVDEGRNFRAPVPFGGAAAGSGGGRGWELYPETVLRRLGRDFPDLEGGVTIAFTSSLPQAAGLSSSSALICALSLALIDGYRLEGRREFRGSFGAWPPTPDRETRERLATYLAAIESGRPFPALGPLPDTPDEEEVARPQGVGTEGGSEDHVAILCARTGHFSRYRFLPLVCESEVPLPAGWILAVAASGVRAEKAAGSLDVFNRLTAEADEIARIWRAETGGSEPHLGAVLGLGAVGAPNPGSVGRLEAFLHARNRAPLVARLRQFQEECVELIPAAVGALSARHAAPLGAAAERSLVLAEEALGNQLPETLHLARSARRLGAHAASPFGAGFGGAVWAIVDAGEADGFLAAWRADYGARFPGRETGSTFFLTGAAPAAFRLR